MSECFNTTILVGKVIEGPTEDPSPSGGPRIRVVLRTTRQIAHAVPGCSGRLLQTTASHLKASWL